MTFKNHIHSALLTVSACLAMASPVLAANSIYLKIPGVKGDVEDKASYGDIRLTSYSQTFTDPYNPNSNGASAAKVACGAVTFQKSVDETSEFFLSHVVQGTVFAQATVNFVHSGGSGETAPYTITLSKLHVTSVSQGDNSSTTAAALGVQETITVVAETFEFSYRTMKPDGTEGNTVKFGWNCQTNGRL